MTKMKWPTKKTLVGRPLFIAAAVQRSIHILEHWD